MNNKKSGICDSCGRDTSLTATSHPQKNNPKVLWYCDSCLFADTKEKKIQALLVLLAVHDPFAGDNPEVMAKLEEQVASEMLTERIAKDTLPPNEQIIETSVV